MWEMKKLFLFYVIEIKMNENNLEYIQMKWKIIVLLKGVSAGIKGKC
jgi:hypothetical protein